MTVISKKPLMISITTTIILTAILLTSNVLTTDVTAQSAPPTSACPPDGTVQHWDKIIFVITEDNQGFIPQEYLNTKLDLKILDTPQVVVNLKDEIVKHLQQTIQTPAPIDPTRLLITIKDVRYQTVTCGLLGPQGPQGPAGPQGPQGETGELSSVTIRKVSTTVPKGQFASLTAECDDGEILTGGGFRNGGSDIQGNVVANEPVGSDGTVNPTEWRASVKAPNNSNLAFSVYALCAEP